MAGAESCFPREAVSPAGLKFLSEVLDSTTDRIGRQLARQKTGRCWALHAFVDWTGNHANGPNSRSSPASGRPRARNGRALAVVDVPDVDLLVLCQVGGIAQVFVDGTGAFVVQLAVQTKAVSAYRWERRPSTAMEDADLAHEEVRALVREAGEPGRHRFDEPDVDDTVLGELGLASARDIDRTRSSLRARRMAAEIQARLADVLGFSAFPRGGGERRACARDLPRLAPSA
jgi:hypothetical protein